MRWMHLGKLAGWLAALLCALLAATNPAMAAEDLSRSLRNPCFDYAAQIGPLAGTAAKPTRWDCSGTRPDLGPERAFMRFSVPSSDTSPHYFVTSRAPFAAFHVFAQGQWRTYRSTEFQPADTGTMVRIALPQGAVEDGAIIVAVDLPTSRMMLEQAQITPRISPTATPDLRELLLLAALCGIMVMPLIFNAAFYPVLRERFVLWHCLLTVSLMVMIFIKSPLANQLTGVSVITMSTIATLAFGTAMASSGMFGYYFIEASRLHPRLRQSLPIAAVTVFMAAFLHAFLPFTLRGIQTDLFYAVCLPVAVIYLATLCNSLLRRSRAGMFQAFGWSVLICVGIIRVVSALTPSLQVTDAMPLFYIGCLVEMVGTTLGVADRFMALKVQRDRAMRDTRSMERRAERDHLTGLGNRSALEKRFNDLRGQGFTTFALLDLDHFKSINDMFGHKRGDEVLCATAAALAADKDMQSFRLGGEEFVLLLRGSNAATRAEGKRQAISTVVSRQVVGLDRVVTASMGLVELPDGDGFHIAFTEAYERADTLLYEAKSTGRNRMVKEKLTLFTKGEPSLHQTTA